MRKIILPGFISAGLLAACITSNAITPTVTLMPFPPPQGDDSGGFQSEPTTPPQATAPTAVPSPTPDPTLPSALALPDSTGTTVACPDNTLRVLLAVSAGTQLTRIAASGDWLYVLVDGTLYRIDRASVDLNTPQAEAVFVPGQDVGGRPVQEVVDVDTDQAGRVFALDKVGHVYRFDPATGEKSLAYRANPDLDSPDGRPANQTVALEVDGAGRLILLETTQGFLMTPDENGVLTPIAEAPSLTTGVDLAEIDGVFYTLQRNGALRTISEGDGSQVWRDAEGRRLGLSLRASDHLGAPLIFVVDGLRREITGYIPGGRAVTRYAFFFPDLGVLRDVAFAGGRMYATAGSDILVHPAPALDGASTIATCPPVNPDYVRPPTLYGVDVLAALAGLRGPFDFMELPTYARLYPGASRLYRYGIHRGVDLYGYPEGWPILAAGDGTVIEAAVDYRPVSAVEFDRMIDEALALGVTPQDNLQRLEGRRVVIDHGGGIYSAYSHLGEIAPTIFPGAVVERGQVIGSVGVSGTEAESRPGRVEPHLHFEWWIGGHYLGQGISIRETMWWFAQIFSER